MNEHIELTDGATAQAMFEAAVMASRAPGDDRPPMVDLTRPAKKSPNAAERASWRRAA